MKKNVILFCLLIMGLTTVKSQLLQDASGNVGIAAGSGTYISKFTVGNAGDTDSYTNIYSNVTSKRNALYVHRNASFSASGDWLRAVFSRSLAVPGKNTLGVDAISNYPDPVSYGRTWGVLGRAGNATNGYNYAVHGALTGTNNGAGIVGSVNYTLDVRVDGIYAGYFLGDVKATGTIYGTVVQSSDVRLKENISSIGGNTLKSNSNNSILSKVAMMEPVEYNYKQVYTEQVSDTATTLYAMFDEDSQLFQHRQYGLIAQDLQTLFPDLVYEQQNGYLAINYTGLIPILIESIKELKEEVDELKNVKDETTFLKNTQASDAVLCQNVPNPFNQTTQINYYLPENITVASLCVYDLQGKQIKQINITNRGEGYEVISGRDLAAGIYLYALIADGNEVDVKRMILTE